MDKAWAENITSSCGVAVSLLLLSLLFLIPKAHKFT